MIVNSGQFGKSIGKTYILDCSRILLDLAVSVSEIHENTIVLDGLFDLGQDLQSSGIVLPVLDESYGKTLSSVGIL